MNYSYSRHKLYFDIETIPAPDNLKDLAIQTSIEKAAKKVGKIKKDKKSIDNFYRLSAISGDFGRVFCVGYAFDDGETKVITGSEPEILQKWWDIADEADLFVGHNIMDFDLRFLYKRSIIHGIKPSAKHINLSFARYRNFPIYDTMREWEKWNHESFIKLDTLAKILNLPTSKDGGIDGSQVYDFYKQKKYDKIYNYCKRDVELTRLIYKKMCFIK